MLNSGWLSLRFGDAEEITTADVILVLDCDVPWINTRCKPRSDAKIYHVDVDPLKQQMPVFYIDALARFKADSATAVNQILKYISSTQSLKEVLTSSMYEERWSNLKNSHAKFLQNIEEQAAPRENGQVSAAFLCNQLRKACPKDTIWCIEAVTLTLIVADQLQASLPGSWINCGGGGLGWSGGGMCLSLVVIRESLLNKRSCFGNQVSVRQRREKEVCVPNCGR